MAKKNLCGVEIEYAEGREFHVGMFHCYGATRVGDKSDPNDTTNNFVTIESDGVCVKVIAMCPHFSDAHAIVCAMDIAKSICDKVMNGAEDAKKSMDEKLRKEDYDIEMMEDKMKELAQADKKPNEIFQYVREHRKDFLVKKPDAKPTDDSKERW